MQLESRSSDVLAAHIDEMCVGVLGDRVDLAAVTALLEARGMELEHERYAAAEEVCATLEDVPLVILGVDPHHPHPLLVDDPILYEPIECHQLNLDRNHRRDRQLRVLRR